MRHFLLIYDIHAFSYKQHFYKQRQAEIGKKKTSKNQATPSG